MFNVSKIFYTDTNARDKYAMVPISNTFFRFKINAITSFSSYIVVHTFLFSTLHFGIKKMILNFNSIF